MSRRNRTNQNKQLVKQNYDRPSENDQRRAALIRQEAHYFTGPIPPAEELEKYSNIIPDGANRIMIMAEEQTKHRMDLERKVIENDLSNSKLGMMLGFILQLTAIVGSMIVAVTQSMWEGILLAIGVIVLGIVNFQLTMRKRERELESHKKTGNNQND